MIQFLEPQSIFKKALQAGFLVENELSFNYVGNYMYMESHFSAFRVVHSFKNINTREYIFFTEVIS